jgi:ATP-binding cassette subfamily C protein
MDSAQWLRLASAPLELGGAGGTLLDDEPRLYVVESGSIALFVAEHRDGVQAGPRRLVTRHGVGQCLVSARTAQGDGLRFVIDSVGDGSVRVVRLADVLRAGPQDADVARLLTQWIASLAHVFSELEGPPIPIRAAAGAVTLAATDALRPEAGETVWARVLSGRVRMLGDERFELDVKSGPFPLGHRMWIEAAGLPARVELCRTAEIQDPEALVAGLARMSALVRAFLARRLAQEGEAEKARLRTRGELRLAQMRDAQAALGAALEGVTPRIHDADPLLAAVRAVGGSLGVPVVPPPVWEDPRRRPDPLEAIARASHLRTRPVVLTDGWWKRDCGDLLASSAAEPRRPLALLRTPGFGYESFDPLDGRRTRLDRDTARTLAPQAVMIYRALPDGRLGLFDLLRFAVERRARDFACILLAGLAATLLGMATPVAMAALMDQAIPDADAALVLALGGALLVTALGRCLFLVGQSFVLARAGTLSQASTQAALWDRLLRLRPSFFRQYSSGDLHARLTAVADVIRELNGAAIRSLFSSSLALLNLVLLFCLSARLALIAVAVALVALCFNAAVSAAMRKRLRVLADLEGKLFGTIVQLVNGVAKLKVAGAQDRTYVQWMRRYAEQLRLRAQAQRLEDWVGVFNLALPTASQAVLFFCAYRLLAGGAGLSLGVFLAFNAAYAAFLAGATELSSTCVGLLDHALEARRVEPILSANPEVDQRKVDPGRLAGSLALERVSFRYRPKGPPVLDEVSVRAEPGEFVALVGPSGSGKSTLLRVLLGFEEIESGQVTYDGQDLSGLDLLAVRRQLGVVLQSGRLNTQSIYENIAGGNSLSLDEAWVAAEQAGLADDVRAMPMGMHTVVSEGGGNLSGGQRQRLLIARALALRPRILLFDEATSALDNKTQAIVSESLRRLRVTRVVIAHRLSTVRHADRIYVLEHGKVVEQGRFQELMDQGGLFARMMSRQVA